jgi:hypothetical protein
MVVKAQALLWMNTPHDEASRRSKNAVTAGTFTSRIDVLWLRLAVMGRVVVGRRAQGL